MILTSTTSQLVAQLKAKLGARLDDTILDTAFLDQLSIVVAGLHSTLYKFGSSALLQTWSEFASFDEITILGKTIRPLVILGRRYGVGDPQPIQTARYTTELTVTATGGEFPAGSLLSDGEHVFRTLIAFDLDTNPTPITIVAVDPSAPALEVGDELRLVVPRSDVDSVALVAGVQPTVPGDTEATYRTKVRDAEANPPRGGSGADFRVWGQEALDVARVFAYTGDLPTQIDLYVQSKTGDDGLASNELLEAVRDLVDYTRDGRASRRGINDAVNYYSITRKVYDVEITDFQGSQEARDAVIEGLERYMLERAPYQVGLDRKPRKDVVSSFGVGGVAQNIAASYGATFSSLELSAYSVFVVSEVLGKGQLAKLGEVNFV